MEQDSSLIDQLAANLQTAIDKKLTVGEAVLMALSGAAGEAFAVTDKRVILVREQMPILGTAAEVDCFDYPYEQISTVRIEDAVGGGHLKLVLTTPPLDEKEVTLFFPHHVLNRFDAAAARIRMLLEQTRSVAVSPAGAAADHMQFTPCAQCGSPVDLGQWTYCANCGSAQGKVCSFCDSLLMGGWRFCPRCGTPTDSARGSSCEGCGSQISVLFAFCPHCGVSQGDRCPRCAGRILPGWQRCPACGNSLLGGTAQQSARSDQVTSAAEPASAEEHNALGRKLYEAEQYAEAIAHFQTAIELDSRNPLYHCNLGVVFAELGREDAALDEYREAIRLAPNDPTPYLNLGYFYSERDNDTEARAALEKVLEVAPGTPEADEASQIIESLHEV